MSGSTLQVDSQRISPLKSMENADGSGTSKHVVGKESSLLIQTKVKTWLEAKGMKIPEQIHVDILGPRRASVVCFHCTKSVALSTRENKNGSWGWIVSNFTQHVLQHASSKRNTLDNYFHRAACTVKDSEYDEKNDSADFDSNEQAAELSIEPAENEINVQNGTEMDTSSVVRSVMQGNAKLVAPILVDPDQEIEYVIYEEVVESYEDREEDRPSDYPEHLTNTSLSSENPRRSPQEILPESSFEHAQDKEMEDKNTLKTVLEISYV